MVLMPILFASDTTLIVHHYFDSFILEGSNVTFPRFSEQTIYVYDIFVTCL